MLNTTIPNSSLPSDAVSTKFRTAEESLKDLLEAAGYDEEKDFIEAEAEKNAKKTALDTARHEGKSAKASKLAAEISKLDEIRASLDSVLELRNQQKQMIAELSTAPSPIEEDLANVVAVTEEAENSAVTSSIPNMSEVAVAADLINTSSIILDDSVKPVDVEQNVAQGSMGEGTADHIMVTEIIGPTIQSQPSEVFEATVDEAGPGSATLVEGETVKPVIQSEQSVPSLKTILSLPPEFEDRIAGGGIDNKKLQELSKKYRQTLDGMPECAEKSLLLLMLHFENEDIKLTYTSDPAVQVNSFMRMEEVKIVLDLLEKQLFSEAMTDRVTKEGMKEIRKLLSEEGSCNDIFNELFKLLKYIQPLDIRLMLELINEALEAADRIQGKDVIQLLGGTGTGKSTTIHFLAGSTMELTEVDGIPHIAPVKIINPEVESFITSPYARSETRIINALSINLSSLDESKVGEITLCDSPGFEDTGGPEIDIANGIGVVRALKGCHSVKPVVLVSGDSIGARFEGLIRLATILAALMPDLESALPSFSYIFTKFSKDQYKGVVAKLESKKRELKPEERANPGLPH